MTSTFGCPHCGKSNPIDAKFCSFCGTNLEEIDAETLAPSQDDGNDDEAPILTPRPPRPARHPRRRMPFPWEQPEREEENDSPNTPAEGRRTRGARSRRRRPSTSDEPLPANPSTPSAPSPDPDSRDNISAPDTPDWPGLLEPLGADELARRLSPTTPRNATLLDDETRRHLRQLYSAEVPLDDVPPPSVSLGGGTDGGGLWRRSWIYWLLLIVLVPALLIDDGPPETLPHVWPGVRPAYDAIEVLPSGTVVLVDWAYDPATAGEMDLVARPVVEHLLARNANLVIVSQLPLGPATARRLIAATGRPIAGEAWLRILDTSLVEGGFLPGGPATLPLLGQAPTIGLPVDLQGRAARARPPLAALAEVPPALTVVIAARSEAVQRWLEQVQPLNRVPTVAVTSAAADPALRPYLDSGQLLGLVGGYSGGIGYRELMAQPLSRPEQIQIWRQIRGHNWALIVLLVVVALSNLFRSGERRNG